jgi:hypothetical protein
MSLVQAFDRSGYNKKEDKQQERDEHDGETAYNNFVNNVLPDSQIIQAMQAFFGPSNFGYTKEAKL